MQGTGAEGLRLALLWERRGQCPGAFPVLAVHDEIVGECDGGKADAAVAWLKAAMVGAMAPLIAPVPVGVEVQVARAWAGGRARTWWGKEGEVGPLKSAVTKFARAIRARVDPAAAARPAADVGRLEQVLADAGGPVGQSQRAGGRVEQPQRPHGPGDHLRRGEAAWSAP